MQFFGEELLPEIGVTGTVKRAAPTEQIYLELKDFTEDFNYEMTDGTWTHLEFESDSITIDDLRRFRAYEAVISYHYGKDWVSHRIPKLRISFINVFILTLLLFS